MRMRLSRHITATSTCNYAPAKRSRLQRNSGWLDGQAPKRFPWLEKKPIAHAHLASPPAPAGSISSRGSE